MQKTDEIQTNNIPYIVELKLNKSADAGMHQIDLNDFYIKSEAWLFPALTME